MFVVDDDAGMRKSLRFLLESAGFSAELFSSATEFLSHYVSQPGCLVLDLHLDGMSGLELHEKLNRTGVKIPTIMISAQAAIPYAVRAMKEGALDFIEKPFDHGVFLAAVNKALEKDASNRRSEAATERVRGRLLKLSERERAVLQGVLVGKSNKVIASELVISAKTIEYHRGKMMQKLGVSSVPELVKLVLSIPKGRAPFAIEGPIGPDFAEE